MDYLTGEDGIFEPERFGLFPPEKVYTTAPVTLEDIEDCSSPASGTGKRMGGM